MRWTLSQPISTVIIGCDNVAQLEENVAIARDFQPLNSAEMACVERKTASYAATASFFKREADGFNGPDTDAQQIDD